MKSHKPQKYLKLLFLTNGVYNGDLGLIFGASGSELCHGTFNFQKNASSLTNLPLADPGHFFCEKFCP